MSILVAVLPSPGVDILGAEEPHASIVWAGPLNEADPGVVSELRTTVPFAGHFHQPFEAMVVGTDMFGQGDEQTYVLRLEAPQLYFLRNVFGALSKSEYPEFKPHLSVPKAPVSWPNKIEFTRIALWLGDARVEPAERYTYWLGTGKPCAS